MFAAGERISEKSLLTEGEVRKGKEGRSSVCGALPPKKQETKHSTTVTTDATAFLQCLIYNVMQMHQVYKGVRGQRVREEDDRRERFGAEYLMFLCQVNINIT